MFWRAATPFWPVFPGSEPRFSRPPATGRGLFCFFAVLKTERFCGTLGKTLENGRCPVCDGPVEERHTPPASSASGAAFFAGLGKDLQVLSGMTELQTLQFEAEGNVDLSPLAGLENLQEVTITNSDAITNWAPLDHARVVNRY